jgi:alpha/beta hydrolase fold
VRALMPIAAGACALASSAPAEHLGRPPPHANRFLRMLAAGGFPNVAEIDAEAMRAAFDESYAAATWLADHAGELDIDPRRIAVGGDSAGGTLAAAVCQMALRNGGPKLALQVLLCPKTDVCADNSRAVRLRQGLFLRSRDAGLGHQAGLPTGL